MAYILTRPYLLPTARLLGEALGIRATSHMKRRPPTIRWGNSDSNNVDTEFNNPDLIRICAQKRLFSERMRDANIPAIEYHFREVPTQYPVCVRTVPNGMRGIGIVIARNEEEFRRAGSGFPWSNWYRFKYEVGVHVLGGQIVRIFKKIRNEGDEEEFPVRNLQRGYSFKLRTTEHFPSLPDVVRRFYAAFPINMCRLDIGWDREAQTYRIIECNSAPGFAENGNTLDSYAEFLANSLGL